MENWKLPELIKSNDDEQTYAHPAFGKIVMSNPVGGENVLFGSEIHHNSVVCIEVRRATLRRSLGRDWQFGEEIVCVFEMSHAQFAEFITSTGKGDGTPVTLRYVAPRGSGIEKTPAIRMPETKHETFRREVRETSAKALEGMTEYLARLEGMVDSGKVGKKELRDIVWNLKICLQNLPTNMAFAVSQGEKALEKATSDAKIEVEAFISATAHRLGLEKISDLARITEKKEEPKREKCTGSCVYSRAMDQAYPRLCIHCGNPEETEG